MGQDHRRYPRASVGLEVTVDAGGSQWQARTVDLSPYGVKVASPATSAKLPPGTSVQLQVPLPDQGPPLSLTARVARTDSDGMALSFGALGDQQLQRLKGLVDSLLLKEWQEVLDQIVVGQPLTAGTGTPHKPKRDVPGPDPEPSVISSTDASERDRWQALLRRLGLENLQLPSNSALARQWREFLSRVEAEQ